MSTFFVATDGDDGNPGTLLSPKRTIPGALTISAIGDTIKVRKGTYIDRWPYNKIYGRDLRAYQGEDVVIDMQGVYSCIAAQALDGSSVTTGTLGLRMIGLKFVNYTGDLFNTVASLNITNATYEIRNCVFIAASTTATIGLSTSGVAGSCIFTVENNTFTNNYMGMTLSLADIFRMNIFTGNTYNVTSNPSSPNETIDALPGTTEKNYNAYAGNTETHGVNLSSTPVGFNDAGNGDYSLAPSSALRGAGKFGSNMGASFNPIICFDALYSDYALSTGINDESYFNTSTMLPGPDGPSDAGPAIYTAGSWRIDNSSVPGAKSARAHLGQVTLLAGAKLTVPGWSALEDTTLGAGSKKVIDNSSADITREIQISIDSGAKQLVSKSTNVNITASTIDFYVVMRIDGQ